MKLNQLALIVGLAVIMFATWTVSAYQKMKSSASMAGAPKTFWQPSRRNRRPRPASSSRMSKDSSGTSFLIRCFRGKVSPSKKWIRRSRSWRTPSSVLDSASVAT